MRKIVISLILILFVCILILNACSASEAIAIPVDIANRLVNEVNMPKGVMVTNENVIETGQLANALLGDEFDSDMYESYAFYPPVMSKNASEFGILKVKESKDVSKAEKIAQRRIDNIQKSFEDFTPEQYEIAKTGEVRTDGRYIYYSMSQNNDRMFNIIEEMLNDK